MIRFIKNIKQAVDTFLKIYAIQVKNEKELTKLLLELINKEDELVRINANFISTLTEYLSHDRKMKLDEVKRERERELSMKETPDDLRY